MVESAVPMVITTRVSVRTRVMEGLTSTQVVHVYGCVTGLENGLATLLCVWVSRLLNKYIHYMYDIKIAHTYSL